MIKIYLYKMDENSVLSSKDKYQLFKDELEKKTKDKHISLNNDLCYLIKESWIKDFTNFGNKQKASSFSKWYKNTYSKTNNDFLKRDIEFINDISSALDCIKVRDAFQLVKKNIIESLYKTSYGLRKNNYANFYTGNNKLIIEFKQKAEKYALLLDNPFTYKKKYF